MEFRWAEVHDIPVLYALINGAYRGDSSRAGWTTEADLLDGQRTDEEELTRLLRQSDSRILLVEEAGQIVGCVHLQRHAPDTVYLGMLVIAPAKQGRGWGSQLLAEAEHRARMLWGVRCFRLQVISLRGELLAWYERRGYRQTGERLPFPMHDPRCGLPKVAELSFAVLSKDAF